MSKEAPLTLDQATARLASFVIDHTDCEDEYTKRAVKSMRAILRHLRAAEARPTRAHQTRDLWLKYALPKRAGRAIGFTQFKHLMEELLPNNQESGK